MEALRSCPFCGGEARIQREGEGMSERIYVTCLTTDCWCSLGEAHDPDGIPDHRFFDLDSAIAAWNKRTNTPDDGEGWAGTKNSVVIHSPRTDPQREQLVKALKALMDAIQSINIGWDFIPGGDDVGQAFDKVRAAYANNTAARGQL
jgi:hypothetical protein